MPPGASDPRELLRNARRHRLSDDQRAPGQRDRDRILYSSALRRLSGVTQVVSADEVHVFHNRLTHTLEVAQVARRLAEKVLGEQPDVAEQLGRVDPDVVEAAALAHDLGHPPFGHVAEEVFQKQAKSWGLTDSFEGNAQTFRILTRLSCRYLDVPGLDLTRATLNAVMKYPWMHDPADPKRCRKWSVYSSEEEDFQWARELGPGDQPCVEAQLMDLADDIAYAVHDLEDFFRARLIPLDQLHRHEREQTRIVDQVFERWTVIGKRTNYTKSYLATALGRVMRLVPFTAPYTGTRVERAALRTFTAGLIRSYVENVRLQPTVGVTIDPALRAEIDILKELTWQYVILDSRMVARDLGQRRVIQTLLRAFDRNPALFPVSLREEQRLLEYSTDPRSAAKRLAIDAVAGMNDVQALHLYHRLSGHALGSLEDAFQLG